jgi:CRP-like cAMP-binding protein
LKLNLSGVGGQDLGEVPYQVQREQYYGRFLRTMEMGELFGEMALETNNPRSATVICLEDTELFIIKKSDYLHIFKESIQQERLEKAMFVQKVFAKVEFGASDRAFTLIYS